MSTADTYLAERDSVDMSGLIDRLLTKKTWIGASILIFAAVFTAAAFLMTPTYRATTVLIDAGTTRGIGSLSSALGQFGDLASLAGINVGGTNSMVEEALAVLRSREFTESFIRDLDLMPQILDDRWDEKAQRWKGDDEDKPTLAQAYAYFHRNIRTISRDRATGLVSVTIEWKDPTQAADWANALVARLNEEMRSRAIADTKAFVGYLETELTTTATVETRQAINRLIEAQINQRMLAAVTEEYAFRVVDKALPPDPKDMVRPRKLVLLALGPLLGLLIGAAAVLISGSWMAREKRVASTSPRYRSSALEK